VIYITFDDEIAEVPLPTPLESLDAGATVQLVELGARCGRRIPIEAAVRLDGSRFIPDQTLQVRNTVGTVLDPGTAYGLVILDHFARPDGVAIRRPSAFVEAWAGDGSVWAASLQPLRDCAPVAGLDPERVALATVFTPHDPMVELTAMRDRVMDPDQVETRPPMALGADTAWSRRRLNLRTHSGLVEMPIFQDGVTPYSNEGGGFVLDDAGAPIIQRWEPVPFAVAWRALESPPDPRPALVFIDGTGWDPWSHLFSGWINDALDQGFVIFSFMPQFHGERAGVTGGPELVTFNFLNPTAGRSNFRQQAVETSFFLRIIREQLTELPDLPPFDAGRVVYGGHSQGALAGAINAAVESHYAAYVFNGLSAYLTLTVLFREDLLDFEIAVRALLGVDREMDLFTPALSLMQTGSEVVDPHNFARFWRGTAHQPDGNHIFVINGYSDDTTTPRGMDHLTISADIPTFDPPGWDIDPFGIGTPPVVQPPVQGNTTALSGRPLTLATYMDSHQGHFTVYRSGVLRRMTIGFWLDALAGEVPRLVPTSELMCGDGQDGAPGADGQDGANALVDTAVEGPGDNCPDGGIALLAGVDDDRDGTLDEGEIDAVAYVCNAPAANVGGDRCIRNQDAVDLLRGVARIDGDLFIVATEVVDLALPSLTTVTGDIEIESNPDLATVDLGGLTSVGGGVDIDHNPNLTDVSLANLSSVGGHLFVGEHRDLERLALANIDRVAGSYIVSTESEADLGIDGLPDFVGGDAYIGDNAGLGALLFGDGFVGGDLTIHRNAALAAARIDGFLFVGFDLFVTDNPALPEDDAIGLALDAQANGDLIVVTGGN